MSIKTYILCPGQGAQHVGMGQDLASRFSAARAVFDAASATLGYDLAAICFNGPEEKLNRTDVSQPAIYATSVASFEAAKQAGLIDLACVTALAGLSLGEYTALHLGGAFGFAEGLRLVAARGKYMQEAAVATPSGMVAIIGADDAVVSELCRGASEGEVLVPANYNAPGQIVVSGSNAACGRFANAASAAGYKAVPLVVAGAFHSPLMQSGADKMAVELANTPTSFPQMPVYSNVTATPHADATSIKRFLVDQIVKPVRWEQTMQSLLAAGEARFVELGPGRVLTGLLRKINRRLVIDNYATADSILAA
ncbi:MAG TPA: ACP S-malonyltransferase [Tepidisphaeraceae bacterium]|nr:ACP S-malonyltransferase [Tepidisphaeraceae bacterium]